ncbi:hypothetical protein ACHAC9_17185 [Massilia sp. CMS3.1]|uniref:hypothetical protein n=1 Tax=Massilia sp. CMS3.1 TaxID=3373083 RepID=UPI003EE62ECC
MGQHLALAELVVIAAMFLQRFSVTAQQGTAPPEPVFNITLRPRAALHLRVTRRAA